MEMHRFDRPDDLRKLREFLAESDPRDYLLEDLEEWTRDGRLWAGVEGGRWISFGRLSDLGHAEGWVSALRVARSRRGQGVGSRFLRGLISDARSIGISELRAVIEDGNSASRRLFARHGFRPVFEMALRRARAGRGPALPLRRARPGDPLGGPVGWVPSLSGRVDVLPGSEGGRFGRWDPNLLSRWAEEGKLYVGPGLAVAVQVDWWREPRTLWVNPIRGEPDSIFPAISLLADTLGHEEWQAFLPSTEPLRQVYTRLGLSPHADWGDRVHLYERVGSTSDPI
jgi:GNAT superfamily N-acetyltransferase